MAEGNQACNCDRYTYYHIKEPGCGFSSLGMTAPPPIKQVLEERGKNYGNFTTQAVISCDIKIALFAKNLIMEPYQREALEMIAHKLSRIVNGDPNYIDSWVDIAGYATLVVDRLKKDKNDGY